MKFLPQNLNIKIYIDKDDIDSTDIVKIYETTGTTTLIATLGSSETDDDPSQTGDAYLFSHTKQVTTPDTYEFYYTISDSYGNESASISTFQKVVCLVPRTPSAPHTPSYDSNTGELTLTISTDTQDTSDSYTLVQTTDSGLNQKTVSSTISDQETEITFFLTEQILQDGGFSDSLYWDEGLYWTISGGVATFNSAPEQGDLKQTITVINGHRYFLRFDMVGGIPELSVEPSINDVTSGVVNGDGTFESIITANTTGSVVFKFKGIQNQTPIVSGYIDNVFLVDLDAADDTYQYTMTANASCGEDSDASEELELEIVSGAVYTEPLTDPENLFLQTIASGKFYLYFNYNTTSDDSITKFNVYVDNDGDPSANNWSLDGSLTYYYSQGSRFRYTTAAQADGTVVNYKVVPASGTYERDNDQTVSGTADAQAPTVTTDYIDIDLI